MVLHQIVFPCSSVTVFFYKTSSLRNKFSNHLHLTQVQVQAWQELGWMCSLQSLWSCLASSGRQRCCPGTRQQLAWDECGDTSHSQATVGKTGRKTAQVHRVWTATHFVHDRLIPNDLTFRQKNVSPYINQIYLLSQRGSKQGTPDKKSHDDI